MYIFTFHTAVIPTPELPNFIAFDSVARFLLGAATAKRSERYISSLERRDLGVPLEVEFEETQSSGADGDMIDRQVSAPGVEYKVQIWSINGANFSSDPLVAATTLLLETGNESGDMARYTNCVRSKIYTVFSLKMRHSKYLSPTRNLSKCILIANKFPASNIHHITLIIRQTGRALQYFVTRDDHLLRAAVLVLC